MRNLSFLSKVAKYIKENHATNVQNLIVVLPNHRAGIYLKHHLSIEFEKTIWSPEIITMDNLMEKISSLKPADSFLLLAELFDIHKKIEIENAKPFDEFMSWGTTLIQDFNEIDISLQDASKIFAYLTETKAISLWNLDGKPLTKIQQSYLRFYNSLYEYYKQLYEKLSKQHLAYKGLIYKTAFLKIETFLSHINNKKIIFAGFNALTNSEEKIIHKLREKQIAELLWDCDDYFIDNKTNEAGNFIRKHIKNWNLKNLNWKENIYNSDYKNINIINVASNVLQSKVAGNILSKIDKNEIFNNETALVLCDEDLLFPTLLSIPSEIDTVNVTMGYNYKNTAHYNLFTSIISMFESSNSISENPENEKFIYYSNLLEILNNLRFCLPKNDLNSKIFIDKFNKSIINLNQSFFSPSKILLLLNNQDGIAEILFDLLDEFDYNAPKIIYKLKSFINNLANLFNDSEKKLCSFDKMQVEQILCSKKIINRLSDIINQNRIALNLKSLAKVFNMFSQEVQISFYGEPLSGLQVMGMLETRGLDFKNLILISVNENIIPKAKSNNSFISLDIKNEFGLNTYRESDSIFAYHFYRLLTRAENIYLVYNSKTDSLIKGEKSRFITQIEHEWRQKNKNIRITYATANLKIQPQIKQEPITIKKDEIIINKLKEIALKGFSPSLLNIYRQCSLKFYFSKIANVKEAETVEDVIAMNSLGTILHEVLSSIYLPHLNKLIINSDFDDIFKNFSRLLENSFEKKFQKEQFSKGKNYLIYMFANKTLRDFITKERNNIKNSKKDNITLQFLYLEQKFKAFIPIKSNIFSESPINIPLEGTIDRIDLWDDVIRIIDYKSSIVNQKDLELDIIDDSSIFQCNDKVFQVLFYTYLYTKATRKIIPNLTAGIISFRRINQWYTPIKLADDIHIFNKPNLEIIEKQITKMIENLLDCSIPFTQTENIESCTFCPYVSLCKIS